MAVTITAAQTTDPGAPQVGVTIAGLSTITGCTVVVTVSWDGGATWRDVRGGTVAGALGSTFIRDYVPALNTASTYQAVVSGGSTATVTAAVTATSTQAWVQDPLAPRTAVPLTTTQDSTALYLLANTGSGITRRQHADMASVIGSSLPVASISVRQQPSGVPLSIEALAASQGALVTSMRALFAQSGQLVLRGLPSALGLDPVVHVVAGDVTENPTVNGLLGVFNAWHLVVHQVRPITMRVVIPYWTYDQVKALVTTQMSPTSPTFANVVAAMPVGKTFTSWVANPGIV